MSSAAGERWRHRPPKEAGVEKELEKGRVQGVPTYRGPCRSPKIPHSYPPGTLPVYPWLPRWLCTRPIQLQRPVPLSGSVCPRKQPGAEGGDWRAESSDVDLGGAAQGFSTSIQIAMITHHDCCHNSEMYLICLTCAMGHRRETKQG